MHLAVDFAGDCLELLVATLTEPLDFIADLGEIAIFEITSWAQAELLEEIVDFASSPNADDWGSGIGGEDQQVQSAADNDITIGGGSLHFCRQAAVHPFDLLLIQARGQSSHQLPVSDWIHWYEDDMVAFALQIFPQVDKSLLIDYFSLRGNAEANFVNARAGAYWRASGACLANGAVRRINGSPETTFFQAAQAGLVAEYNKAASCQASIDPGIDPLDQPLLIKQGKINSPQTQQTGK